MRITFTPQNKRKKMKKYFVARTYKSGTYLPDIEFNTDSDPGPLGSRMTGM